jgi:P4 family phage/plasmid primase-like protien
MSIDEDLFKYQSNAWPAMVAELAHDLGVSARALVAIGIGWMPLDGCWVFPERNAQGKAIGLVRRYRDGQKYSIKGSERGLTYAINPDFDPQVKDYTPGAQNWTRCSEEYPCPVCGKADWCLVSSENPADPKAAICGRTPEGATQAIGESGYLHIRKESGRVRGCSNPLTQSTLPVLIVEGQSDVATAYDLGYTAAGKPSAAGGLALLSELLVGRDVVVIGENDAGAGKLGMEKTYETLKPKVKSVVKLLPPDGVKDLRAWKKSGLTPAILEKAIRESAVTTSSSELLESIAPLDIADRWLHERHWLRGLPILRQYCGNWYRFDGSKYAQVEEKQYIRGDLYGFLRGKTSKKVTKEGINIEPYVADMGKVSCIIDTLSMTCPVYTDAPCWLDQENHPCTSDLVTFVNGTLDVTAGTTVRPASPVLFSLTAMPYKWHPGAQCPRWLKFLQEIFPNDPQKIVLLQEWFGYNMVADTSQEKLMFFVGRPGAGKGTVLEALRAVLGSDQVASTSFDTLVGDFGLQPLVGKLAAILPDAHITRRGDPEKALQVLKEISGRDSVSVNRKNKDFLSDHKLSVRFTISVNSMPDLPDHERSLDRRLLLLHFGESFAGREDTDLKTKITAEAPGIAVWAIQGLLRLRSRGFTQPASSVPVVEEFRKQSSPITEFADEFCVFGNYVVEGRMFYDAYSKWCRDQGVFCGSQIKLTNRLTMMYPGIRSDRVIIGNRQVRGYEGIKLTNEAVERYLVRR